MTGKNEPQKLTALDGISFKVDRGEVLGIVGRNGSGKSTLLSTIAGIYKPTSGEVRVNGKITPLLNLGVGLQRRLTMRDNIYLTGALLGLSREYMRDNFDAIVDFSGLNDFVDFKLFQFSNGMIARLSFAIAIHSDPEILLLDEVFQAGDAGFSKKSGGKMKELVRSDTTVVLSSHNDEIIRDAVDRVLWIDKGKIMLIGSPKEVLDAYASDREKKRSGWMNNRKKFFEVFG